MASEGTAVLRSQELNLVLGPMGFQLRASWENFAIHTQGTKTRQETYAKDQEKGELKRTYRGFLPYATFGTWKKFALAKNRISKIFILCTQ